MNNPNSSPIYHQQRNRRISLCTTYDAHDPVLLDGVMPFVDFLEITPDTIAVMKNGQVGLHPGIIAALQERAGQLSYIAHGVGLSIGSYDGYSEDYLRLLEQLMDAIPLKWHSEHLGYTTVDGAPLNTMLAVPRTAEMLDLLIPRIRTLLQRYGLPFLLENIVHLLPEYEPEYSDAEFLNLLCAETGCGLILDLYNLECDAFNYGFDVNGFLQELDLSKVREIHLAGGSEHKGFQLDIHSTALADSTLQLALDTAGRCENLEVVTYEILPQAVSRYGQQLVVDELRRLQSWMSVKVDECKSV